MNNEACLIKACIIIFMNNYKRAYFYFSLQITNLENTLVIYTLHYRYAYHGNHYVSDTN